MGSATVAVADVADRLQPLLDDSRRTCRRPESTAAVLLAVARLAERGDGVAPSIREVGNEAGLSSTSTVNLHLQTLVRLGLVKRSNVIGSPRTLRATDEGRELIFNACGSANPEPGGPVRADPAPPTKDAKATVLIDTEVYRLGACRDAAIGELDAETWSEAARVIRRWCAHCPVVARCHRQAEHGREWGVWGGRYRTQQHHADNHAEYTLAELEAGPNAQKVS